MSLPRKSNQKQTQKQPNNLDDDDDIILDDDITFGRNRQAKKFGRIVHDNAGLSDYVIKRLAKSRQLALAAYKKAQI